MSSVWKSLSMVVSLAGLPLSLLLDVLSASFDAAGFAFSPHWARLVISARCCRC